MKLRIKAPSRLHFGLFGWGGHALRQFGGFGLMIESPCLEMSAEISSSDSISGQVHDTHKIESLVNLARESLKAQGFNVPFLKLHVHRAPPQHQGLGSGTQLAMTIARLASKFAGYADEPQSPEVLAGLVKRFPRSGVGAHGFCSGGLIVDGGHTQGLQKHQELAPIVAQLPWPEAWQVVLVTPREPEGVSGMQEANAFGTLPDPSRQSLAELSQTVLTGFLPSVKLAMFHESMNFLEAAQKLVGTWFAPAQNSCVYGSAHRDNLVALMNDCGLRGVGQSSWGPTLFGFCQVHEIDSISARLNSRFMTQRISPNLLQTRVSSSGHQITMTAE